MSEYINNKITELHDMKNNIVKEHQETQSDKTLPKDLPQISDILDMWGDMDIEERKSIVKHFIQTIYISKNKLKIEWKYGK